MKKMGLVAVALMGLAGMVRAQATGAGAGAGASATPAVSLSVVEITDMRGQPGYEVMTREEYATLMKEIKEETAAFGPAVAEAKKEWEANKENKTPFQGSRIKPRTAKKIGTEFKEREKADKKKSQLEGKDKPADSAKEPKKVKPSKSKADATPKVDERAKALDEAYSLISRKMADKLGRSVPSNGFGFR